MISKTKNARLIDSEIMTRKVELITSLYFILVTFFESWIILSSFEDASVLACGNSRATENKEY